MKTARGHDGQAMAAINADGPFDDLLDHLVQRSALTKREAMQLVGEVLAYFNEPLEQFVRRRHGELQRQGFANTAIYSRIAEDLRWWRLAAPALSERQIRRIVYG